MPSQLHPEDRGGVLVALPHRALDVHFKDLRVFRGDGLFDRLDILDLAEFDEHRDVAQAALVGDLHRLQRLHGDDDEDRRGQHRLVEARAGGEAEARGAEQSDGGGQAGHLLVRHADDRAGGKEADAADDARGKACAVELEIGAGHRGPDVIEHVPLVKGDDDRQRRADTGEHVGAQTRAALLARASKADGAAGGQRQQQTEQHGAEVELPQICEHVRHADTSPV